MAETFTEKKLCTQQQGLQWSLVQGGSPVLFFGGCHTGDLSHHREEGVFPLLVLFLGNKLASGL